MNRREQSKAQTCADVLAAARELFALDGYERTGLRVIAKRANVSTGAIMAQWPSKEALFEEAMGRPVVTDAMGAWLAHRAVPTGPIDGVRAIIRAAKAATS